MPVPPTSSAGARDATANAAPLVRFDEVSKRFGTFTAVDRLSLDIQQGEFFALLGPSGCGKTTLLRMLAGFETPSAGRILLDGADISTVPPYRRPVNMVFQSYALFPHLTVAGNVAFGLKQERLPRTEIEARVRDALALVKLDELGQRKPEQLSGGQRQRVALARALVKRPRVFLLDEPLAALDKKLREDTQFELMDLQTKLGLTFIIVTHDQEEAMTMAGRIGVMNQGRLVQVATPAELYEQPNSRWVADFIGDINLIEGRVVESSPGGVIVETKSGRFRSADKTDVPNGATVWLALRPEKLRITSQPPQQAGGNSVAGMVSDVGYLGDISIYKVRLDSGEMMKAAVANLTRMLDRPIGSDARVWLSWTPDAGALLTE